MLARRACKPSASSASLAAAEEVFGSRRRRRSSDLLRQSRPAAAAAAAAARAGDSLFLLPSFASLPSTQKQKHEASKQRLKAKKQGKNYRASLIIIDQQRSGSRPARSNFRFSPLIGKNSAAALYNQGSALSRSFDSRPTYIIVIIKKSKKGGERFFLTFRP
jgi:hypothetical protein